MVRVMSRVRSIKPQLLEDEKLGSVPPLARYLAIALILMADDRGNMRGSAGFVRGRAFAYDDVAMPDVQTWLEQLDAVGYAKLYYVNGEQFIHLVNWERHQKIGNPARYYPVPGLDEADTSKKLQESTSISEEVVDPTLARASQTSDIRHQTSDTKKPPNGGMSSKEPDAPPADAQEVFDYWKEQMGKAKARFIPKRRTAIKARFKEGYTVEDCKLAIDGCKASSYHMGENTEGKDGAGVVYDGFQLIFRAGNVERFQGYATNKPKLKDGIQADGIYREPNRKDKVLF